MALALDANLKGSSAVQLARATRLAGMSGTVALDRSGERVAFSHELLNYRSAAGGGGARRLAAEEEQPWWANLSSVPVLSLRSSVESAARPAPSQPFRVLQHRQNRSNLPNGGQKSRTLYEHGVSCCHIDICWKLVHIFKPIGQPRV